MLQSPHAELKKTTTFNCCFLNGRERCHGNYSSVPKSKEGIAFIFTFFSVLPADVCQQQSLTNLRRLKRGPFTLELLDVICVTKCFYNYLKIEKTDLMSYISCLCSQIFSALNRLRERSHNENTHSLNVFFCFRMHT